MKNHFENRYQLALIFFSTCVVILMGAFIYFELFPEYKVYQEAYVDLEKFRSEMTGDPVPQFSYGVKQTLIPSDHVGPEAVDRCMSCHVPVNLPHFSKEILRRDINGEVMYDSDGLPLKENNPQYVWKLLDERVAELTSDVMNQSHLKEAESLQNLRFQKVAGLNVDMSKVLVAHPYIGSEEQLFDLHPIEEYACTTCHSGNGQSLVAKRAHGPYFDELLHDAHAPSFTEIDPENDPRFSKKFNERPEHDLLFQTTPLLTGSLIESRCVQCHEGGREKINSIVSDIESIAGRENKRVIRLNKSIKSNVSALVRCIEIYQLLEIRGYKNALALMNQQLEDLSNSPESLDRINSNRTFLLSVQDEVDKEKALNNKLLNEMNFIIKDEEISKFLLKKGKGILGDALYHFVHSHIIHTSEGSALIINKREKVKSFSNIVRQFNNIAKPLQILNQQEDAGSLITPSLNRSLSEFEKGRMLFFSNACYTCHGIEGISRGGVGPDLTEIGNNYPWYIKESIVWPQADLKSSVMPNFRMDHDDIEKLMVFLMAQKGSSAKVSKMNQAQFKKGWESGLKNIWEEPINPAEMDDLSFGMDSFASEGCSSCHRIKGFKSNVGFAIEKTKANPINLLSERDQFRSLFPEGIIGSDIVAQLDQHHEYLNLHLSVDVRSDSILEKILKKHPELIEGIYTNFKFASRAKNAYYKDKLINAGSEGEKKDVLANQKEWRTLVRNVLMVYIQEYGFGREVAPKLSYSGIYRSTEWLMGHFKNPATYTARSYMPTFPFDETKFYALTLMLQKLGKLNQNTLGETWKDQGFNPSAVYQELCASCHGDNLNGNGPISELLYPIPKNLRDPTFLRNLTKKRALESINSGVKGTPMPPWGEHYENSSHPVLNKQQANLLVDWLYADLPSGQEDSSEDVLKWSLTPQDIVKEIGTSSSSLSPISETKSVPSYFMTKDSPDSVDGTSFYIRKKFYTEFNLEQGRQDFLINCSHCHGKDADGSGIRSITMEDAKPRVLTNLPWLQSRDDLRLLRSIQFGVSGTSMTPWGDKTSITQRMQMVMYIRSLSEKKDLEDRVQKRLFKTFGESIILINQARAKSYSRLELTEKAYKNAIATKELSLSDLQSGNLGIEETISSYKVELELMQKVVKLSEIDKRYIKLADLVLKSQKIFSKMGSNLIDTPSFSKVLSSFFKIIENQEILIERTEMNKMAVSSTKLAQANDVKEMLHEIELIIQNEKTSLSQLRGQFSTPAQKDQIKYLRSRINTLTTMRAEMARSFEIVRNIRKEQQVIIRKIQDI